MGAVWHHQDGPAGQGGPPRCHHRTQHPRRPGPVGTIIKITLAGGFSYKEKFTKVDHKNRVKETEAIEGGFLDMGLSLYRSRFEVIGKDEEESCMIKSTI
ncbi:hypothetical protein ACJRO7_002968 [Eucalyptus globulus]|uniref:Bet v I/Major latex protein domain-containing protein n=1 Tax=Eucalyptus globulus TaxID=34317 RepID=A0ABD3LX22_EUCGL